MGQIVSSCRSKKTKSSENVDIPLPPVKCDPIPITPTDHCHFPSVGDFISVFPHGYLILVKTKYNDQCAQTSNQWIQDLRLVGEIVDPDGWRHMRISFDTVVTFDQFRKAFNGHNTTLGKKYLLSNKANNIWHIITIKGK